MGRATGVAKFSLRLVDAATGEPLKEYTDSQGREWVAGEDDQEFFVELANEAGAGRVKAFVTVDGSSIGYNWQIVGEAASSSQLGPLKTGQQTAAGATVVAHAFKFKQADETGDDGEASEGAPPPYGRVEVSWKRATLSDVPTPTQGFQTAAWAGKGVSTSSKKEGMGALKSSTGAAPTSLAWSSQSWTVHDEVASATILYSSQFGLAVRGMRPDARPVAGTSADADDEPLQGPARRRRRTEGRDESSAIVLE
ncbi:hypothetical protein EMIHUDRAFT_363482 [Emiliania huxleyi CCMP1516]|uniref:Uncharacterized protein n=3 Tax=Emiliania huxleyi TaxID=2903 RepID=A0A0D3KFB1_EMIH1|nr:hypothetical protein EMIHUDRAFT_363482 [Emiliania huxleyi CCMP1516]EOD34446.1 hypothetical protein EMIHUDRAFT_363482 [Emiliania huxleyi CCMP1516]|eukprot:XP_005786875.1 hypothetical protein EMIHUDRAFT_363482 [Emiliania huxleyi CCMP1516]